MRVLLDTTPARRSRSGAAGRSGTRVYIEMLAAALRARGEVELVEVSQRFRMRPGRAGRRRNPLRSAVNLLLDVAWLQLALPRAARAAEADVLHHPLPAYSGRSPCPQVVTVQDVAFVKFPDQFDPIWRRLAIRRHRSAVRRADAVIAISKATEVEAVELLGAPRGRVVAAPLGPGQALPERERHERPAHFLYVGDAEPRKGVGELIASHEAYRRAGGSLELVLAGTAGHVVGDEHGDGPAPGVRVRPEPGAPELADLHAAAAALVHPSLHEGFGLTLAEAMALGTPVVAVRNAAVEELCGDAALLVSRDELPAALARIERDGELREKLSGAGRVRAASLSWDEAARLHEAAYTLAAG